MKVKTVFQKFQTGWRDLNYFKFQKLKPYNYGNNYYKHWLLAQCISEDKFLYKLSPYYRIFNEKLKLLS